MKRLLLALVLVIAGAAIFLGPPLRSAFADTEVEITLGRAPMHPTQQALNFMLDAPEEAALPAKKKMKLWATYYHMPTVRPSWTSVAAKPSSSSVPVVMSFTSPDMEAKMRLGALPVPPQTMRSANSVTAAG